MLVLNKQFFIIRPCGVCLYKENGASSTVQVNLTTMNGMPLEYVLSFNDLGVIIDNDLSQKSQNL